MNDRDRKYLDALAEKIENQGKELSQKIEGQVVELSRLTGSIKGNGGRGMAGQVEEHDDKIETMQLILEHVQTKEGCAETAAACKALRKEEIQQTVAAVLDHRGRNPWLVRKDIILGIVGPAGGAGLLLGLLQLLQWLSSRGTP